MSLCLLFSFMMSLSLILPMMMQPLSLGLTLMVLSATSCLMMGLTCSSWYGYILFLIYVGGLLVMFAYVAVLAPNVLFSNLISIFILLSISLIISVLTYSTIFLGASIHSFSLDFSSSKFDQVVGDLMVSPFTVGVLVGLGTVLLINLLSVVKICQYQHGPLRLFNQSH